MKDATDDAHEHGLIFSTRTIHLSGEVDTDMTSKLALNLSLLQMRGSTQPITIVINSGGGDVQQALAMYDFIRSSGCHITTVALGSCESSACILLQAGDLRKAYRGTTVMYHSGTDSIPELSTEEFPANYAHCRVLDKLCNDIIYARMRAANPKLKPSQFKRMVASGMYYAGASVVTWGLVDEIL